MNSANSKIILVQNKLEEINFSSQPLVHLRKTLKIKSHTPTNISCLCYIKDTFLCNKTKLKNSGRKKNDL